MQRARGARRRGFLGGLACLPWMADAPAAAARGLVVAQVAPFSGPTADDAKGLFAGAAACFAAHNQRGQGPRIELLPFDDGLSPQKTVQLWREVAATHRPLAFLYPVSPPCVEAVLSAQLPAQLGIPLLGTMPAMQKWRAAVDPWVFHVGVGEDVQMRKLAEHAAALGVRRIGIAYWDAPAVRETIAAFVRIAAARGLAVAADCPTPVQGGEAAAGAVAARMTQAGVQAAMCFLPTVEAAALARRLREADNRCFLYGLSFIESRLLFERAGARNAVGFGLSQYLPNPFDAHRPLVARYQADLGRHGPAGAQVGVLSFEGYVAATLLLAALGGAAQASPAGVRAGLEALRRVDLGGLVADYSERKHVGLDFIDLGVVVDGGRMVY